MTVRAILGASALLLSLSLAPSAHAMYCGHRLVSKDDTATRVRSLCGEPSDVIRSVATVTRSFTQWMYGMLVWQTVSVPVEVEEWTYDLGPSQFIRLLRFEDGRLVEIRTGEYGTPHGGDTKH